MPIAATAVKVGDNEFSLMIMVLNFRESLHKLSKHAKAVKVISVGDS